MAGLMTVTYNTVSFHWKLTAVTWLHVTRKVPEMLMPSVPEFGCPECVTDATSKFNTNFITVS